MKRRLPVLVGAFALVLLLLLVTVAVVLLGTSMIVANADRFAIGPIVAFARGWERFWMAIYLAAEAGKFVVFGLVFLELALFLFRTMLAVATRALASATGRDPARMLAACKRISLFGVVTGSGKRGLIRAVVVYVAVLLLVFGGSELGKLVLKANDSLVYRSHLVLHRESELVETDMADEIDDEAIYALDIRAGVGNVDIYAVDDATSIKIYFLYDTEAQRASLAYDVDLDDDRITIAFSEAETGYERYVDPVPMGVEIYLPADLAIGTVSVELAAYGNLTVDWLAFALLEADVARGDIRVSASDRTVGAIRLTSVAGAVYVRVDACVSLQVSLEYGASLTASVQTIENTLEIMATAGADLYVYATTADRFVLTAANSRIELREVYAPETVVTILDASTLLYVNGNPAYAYVDFTVNAFGSEATLRGVPDDSAR